MEGTLETKKIDTPTQFEGEVGYKPSPEVWKPINTTSQKLAELKEDLGKLAPENRAQKAAEFIKANQVSSEKTAVTPAVATGVVGATVSDSISDSIKDVKKTFLKDLGFFGMLFVDPKTLDPKDVADQVKGLIEKKKSGGFFEKIFSSFQLHFLLGKVKQAKISLDSCLSDDELKSIHLTKSTTISEKKEGGENGEKKAEAEKFLSSQSYALTTKLLIYGASRQKFDTALGAAVSGLKDATWGLDDVKKKEAIMSNTINILSYPKVKEKTWSEFISMGENGMVSFLGNNDEKTKASVQLIFQMMAIQSSRLEKVFSPNKWKDIPLGKMMATLYEKEGHQKVEELTEKIKDIDFSKITEVPADLLAKISKKDDGSIQIGGILSADYESIKAQGITGGFLFEMLENERGKQSVKEFKRNMGNYQFSSQESGFMEKILDGNKFFGPLKQSITNRFGFTPDLLNFLGEDSMSAKDMLEFYIITQGETDISRLSKGRKALLFTKLQMLFLVKNPNSMGLYFKKLLEEGELKYPDALEVGTIIDTALNYSAYKATFKTVESGEKLLDGLLGLGGIGVENRTVKAIGGGAALAGIVWLAIKLSPIGRVGSAIAMILAALGITSVTLAQGK